MNKNYFWKKKRCNLITFIFLLPLSPWCGDFQVPSSGNLELFKGFSVQPGWCQNPSPPIPLMLNLLRILPSVCSKSLFSIPLKCVMNSESGCVPMTGIYISPWYDLCDKLDVKYKKIFRMMLLLSPWNYINWLPTFCEHIKLSMKDTTMQGSKELTEIVSEKESVQVSEHSFWENVSITFWTHQSHENFQSISTWSCGCANLIICQENATFTFCLSDVHVTL